jgi:hypothetical protein
MQRAGQPRCFFALDFFAEVLLLDECDDLAATFDLLDLALLALADLLDFERDACDELLP